MEEKSAGVEVTEQKHNSNLLGHPRMFVAGIETIDSRFPPQDVGGSSPPEHRRVLPGFAEDTVALVAKKHGHFASPAKPAGITYRKTDAESN